MSYTRAVSVQKCLRAGGKHNDLENVGKTARHHTFFEMLGNFSFGDYFKEEAIGLAWEFLTERLGLPKERLWVTIFRDDDEAGEIWRKSIGLPPDRIVRCGEKDNFWSMGDTGPCGPCSEIHFDQGEGVGCLTAGCGVECDCDRYLEVWNLVFMQWSRDEKGVLTPLPKPSIDTGMGLERLTSVVQGKNSNYDTDLFSGTFAHLQEISGKIYGKSQSDDISMRVIADHIRAVVFLLTDGVLPSNEGRGYVLRRIMRRASRHGRLLGMSGPFLYLTAGVVADELGDVYPDLIESRDYCADLIRHEEERFLATLDHGLKLLEEEIKKVKDAGTKPKLPGEVAFRLYDTYGFPLDLTEDILEGAGLTVERAGFDRAMEAQREAARLSWAGSGEGKAAAVYGEILNRLKKDEGIDETPFIGYQDIKAKGRILYILKDGIEVGEAVRGDEVEIITDRSPFYASSGGQVGDVGTIIPLRRDSGGLLAVSDTQKPVTGLIVHKGRVEKGALKAGETVELAVDLSRRRSTEKHHTATHLLHAALKSVLGDHVKQAGSLVEAGRLRFDFTHFSALTGRQVRSIEEMVNCEIWKGKKVHTEVLPLDEAKARGAAALFGEKYGHMVRVVTVPGFSMELCGGTHVENVGEIGPFKIVSEGGVAAGVRRIEAVTGESAYSRIVAEEDELRKIGALLKGKPGEIGRKVETLLMKQKSLEAQIESLKEKLASAGETDMLGRVKEAAGVKVLAEKVEGADSKTLRGLIDKLKGRIGSGVIALGSAEKGKALLIVGVTGDLTGTLQAGRIIGEIAPVIGGRGGGRPDMAQAGGQDVSKLGEALEKTISVVEKMMG